MPTDTSGSRSSKQTSGAQDPSLHETLLATRADLSEAQRSRSELQGRLARVTAELEKLRKRNTHDSRRIHAYGGEVAHLQLRLKDRDEELRGKAKLLDVCYRSLSPSVSVCSVTDPIALGFPRRASIVESPIEHGRRADFPARAGKPRAR